MAKHGEIKHEGWEGLLLGDHEDSSEDAVSQGGQCSVLGVAPTKDSEGLLSGYTCHEFREG